MIHGNYIRSKTMSENISKLVHAIHFSAVAHRNQRRKDSDKTPYINHPIEVMHILSEAGITDIDTLCAAVLHDTIEDTGVSYEQLCNEFGTSVACIVSECSDDKSLPKEVRKQEQIKHAAHVSNQAKLVKSADKLSNLCGLDINPPTKWSQEEINGYFTWSYAVWLSLRGCNKNLDNQLEKLFSSKELLTITPEELENRLTSYYGNIKYSE